MSDSGGKIGVAEARVGVPFPAVALEVVRAVVPAHHVQEVFYTGNLYDVHSALTRGLIDEIVPPENLMDRAQSIAQQFAAIHTPTFSLTKKQLRYAACENMKRLEQKYDKEILEQWMSPKTHEIVKTYLEKTIGAKL